MKKKLNPLDVTSIPAENLADIPQQIENLGGYRKQIANHVTDSADTLSNVIGKIKSKGGTALRMMNTPGIKKVLGILPMAGAGMAALNGDPAMAAEELAQDATGPVGAFYDAVKPDVAGNPEDDAMMQAESDAYQNYQNSPASQNARFQKLKSLIGR